MASIRIKTLNRLRKCQSELCALLKDAHGQDAACLDQVITRVNELAHRTEGLFSGRAQLPPVGQPSGDTSTF